VRILSPWRRTCDRNSRGEKRKAREWPSVSLRNSTHPVAASFRKLSRWFVMVGNYHVYSKRFCILNFFLTAYSTIDGYNKFYSFFMIKFYKFVVKAITFFGRYIP